MPIGVLFIEIQIPGCTSLKQKRSIILSLLAYIHKTYNVSASEFGKLDSRDEAILACAVISNDPTHNRKILATISAQISAERPDLEIVDTKIELL